MQHLDEGTIHAWLDGALNDEETTAIARHLVECATCTAQVAEARGMIAGASRIVSSLDVVRGNVIPPAAPVRAGSVWRRLRLTPARAALAASVLLAVSAMLAVRHDTPNKMVPKTVVSGPDARVSAPAAATAPAPATAVPARSVSVVRPDSAAAQPRAETTATAAPPAKAAMSTAAANQAVAASAGTAVDTVKPHDEKAARIVAAPQSFSPAATAAAAGAPGFASAQGVSARPAMNEMRSAALGALTPGCYLVERDSSAWLRVIPPRFALVRDDAAQRNVVRAITLDAHIDSVVPGSAWREIPNRGIVVDFRAQPELRPVSLTLSASGRVAEATSGAESRPVEVRRVGCPH
ncbi:MAG TPA: zf-HC2 domain-containing protein [Gemmatimonadaceae bacterium]|nr:zf-HC2 domain-containing protein [Gemmatimonadaceae bacterium]